VIPKKEKLGQKQQENAVNEYYTFKDKKHVLSYSFVFFPDASFPMIIISTPRIQPADEVL